MEDAGPGANFIIFFILLFVNAVLCSFECAMKHMNEAEAERRAEEEKDSKSIRIKAFLDRPEPVENTVRLLTTFHYLWMGCICFRFMQSSVWKSAKEILSNVSGKTALPEELLYAVVLALVFLAALYIIMTLGVLLPKKLGEHFRDRWVYLWITPIYDLKLLCTPMNALVGVGAGLVMKLFGDKKSGNEAEVIEDEIISMVNEGHEQGYIEESEAKMISNIFEFGDKEVKDIMTNRSQVVAFDADMTLEEAIECMLTERYTRYPVYRENLDQIIGVLYFKDAMRLRASGKMLKKPLSAVEGLLRKPVYVPQTKNIDELFRKMQAEKVQLAIVIDEYGQTDGLVAMEDILEEIVGNILDEYDDEGKFIEETGADEYRMEGLTPLETLEERFGISFDGEPFETLNGFLISRMDRIPEADEQFEMDYQGFHFRILSVENKMIQSVLVKKNPESVEMEPDSESDNNFS